MSEERNYVHNELTTLKDNLFKRKATTKSANAGGSRVYCARLMYLENHAEFKLIHVIIVVMVVIMVGIIVDVHQLGGRRLRIRMIGVHQQINVLAVRPRVDHPLRFRVPESN